MKERNEKLHTNDFYYPLTTFRYDDDIKPYSLIFVFWKMCLNMLILPSMFMLIIYVDSGTDRN